MVVYLHAIGREIPSSVVNTLGFSHKRIPELNLEWIEVLLSYCLYHGADNFKQSEAVEQIVKLESGALGGNLRCVILTDFIRKAELPRSGHEVPRFENIGIVPVFESLRAASVPNVRAMYASTEAYRKAKENLQKAVKQRLKRDSNPPSPDRVSSRGTVAPIQ